MACTVAYTSFQRRLLGLGPEDGNIGTSLRPPYHTSRCPLDEVVTVRNVTQQLAFRLVTRENSGSSPHLIRR